MSELINRKSISNWKLSLLATASTLSLVGFTPAVAGSDRGPAVWIEIGGQLEKADGVNAMFSAPFAMGAATANGFTPVDNIVRDPRYFNGFEGRVSIISDDNWSFSAALRYGRASRKRALHEQTAPNAAKNIQSIPALAHYSLYYISPLSRRYLDAASHRDASYAVVDFVAGKDVGIGLLHGSVGAGVRFAQFSSKSSGTINANPDFSFSYSNVTQHRYFRPLRRVITFYTQSAHQKWHLYDESSWSNRSFHGIGPSLSWNSSFPLIGSADQGALIFDWGLNAAILFGRQKAKVHHQTTGRYRSMHNAYEPTVVYQHATQHTRSRALVVPNVGAFAGLSFKYANAKLNLGYRGDFFFGAMDGGIDTRKSYDRSFYGPFATISFGFGG